MNNDNKPVDKQASSGTLKRTLLFAAVSDAAGGTFVLISDFLLVLSFESSAPAAMVPIPVPTTTLPTPSKAEYL